MSADADFTMGMDPEIIFMSAQDKLINAAEYLPHPVRGGPGAEKVELGTDGHPWIAELRPQPGTPEFLTKELKRIMLNGKSRLPNGTKWLAGSFVSGKSIGGHIHYGFPPTEEIITSLDGVLSQTLACIEPTDQAKARRKGQYGKLHCQDHDAIRKKPYGFEYRTPGSFVVSPTVTLGVLALAKALGYEDRIQGPLWTRKLKSAQLRLLTVDTDRYNAADRAHFLGKLNELWGMVRQYRFWSTPEGKGLWKHCTVLRTLATYATGWDNGYDLLHRWKIQNRAVIKRQRRSLKPNVVQGGVLADRDLWRQIQEVDLGVEPEPGLGDAERGRRDWNWIFDEGG